MATSDVVTAALARAEPVFTPEVSLFVSFRSIESLNQLTKFSASLLTYIIILVS
jgi:hypothetical protein